ncbi:MAG: lysophospholipase [Eubacterium sp.]|nr:lysophospholipase [Eubacterium sp.]
MPELKEFTFLSTDGKTQIYVREYLPDGNIRGTVQIAHGVAEYCNRYDDFMIYLAEHGFAVCANDHLGHGKSVQDEAHRRFFAEEDGWSKVVGDIKQLRDIQKNKYPDVPSVLLGHSMGSFLARTFMIKFPNDFDAFILSGTGQMSRLIVKIGYSLAKGECGKTGAMTPSPKLYKTAFGSYNKKIANPKTENDWLSRNEANVAAYEADPLCGGICSAGLYRDMMGGLVFISDKKNLLKMNKKAPVLFIAGTEDPVGGYGQGVVKACELFRWALMKDVTLKLYEGDRHEILNEDDKGTVYEDVLTWICAKVLGTGIDGTLLENAQAPAGPTSEEEAVAKLQKRLNRKL